MTENKNASSIKFEIFRAQGRTSWDDVLTNASEFASKIGKERLINISHSSDQGQGSVVVWYTELVK